MRKMRFWARLRHAGCVFVAAALLAGIPASVDAAVKASGSAAYETQAKAGASLGAKVVARSVEPVLDPQAVAPSGTPALDPQAVAPSGTPVLDPQAVAPSGTPAPTPNLRITVSAESEPQPPVVQRPVTPPPAPAFMTVSLTQAVPASELSPQLAKLVGLVAGKRSRFTDLPSDDWAYGNVLWLVSAGILRGDEVAPSAAMDTSGLVAAKMAIRPDDLLTREELAVMIARLAEMPRIDVAGSVTSAGNVHAAGMSPAAGAAQPAASAAHSIAPAAAAPSVASSAAAPSAVSLYPATVSATAASPASATAQSAAVADFADVPSDAWNYSYIGAASEYISDFSRIGGERFFRPTQPAQRGTVAAAALKLAGEEAASADMMALEAFSDGAGAWGVWRPYAAIAVEKGVIGGYDDGTLRLDEGVTRKEACAIIARAIEGRIALPEAARPVAYLPEIDSDFYDEYFDDAVFVGDSITMEMYIHIRNLRKEGSYPLSDCRFCAQYVYGLRIAAGSFDPSNKNVSYNGVAGPLEDVLMRMGAKDVYLMLGMNDHAGASLPGSIEKYETIVDKIQAKNPEARIFIQFLTPVTKEREGKLLNNANTDRFNQAIVELCERRGLDWIDINTPLKGDDNALVYEWSSDRFAHLNKSGYAAWFNALREFACVKYLSGEWSPPASAQAPEAYAGRYVYLD